jgi:hypothetical protein
MGSPSIPAAPEAPDYAAANREGIFSDIETLATRRLIEQAAQLGTKVDYQFPIDKAVLDSKGKPVLGADGKPKVERTFETRSADFTGLGNIEAAKALAELASTTNADLQRQQLTLRQELGVANAEQTAKEIAAADPLAYQTRQELTGQVLGDLKDPASAVAPSTEVAQAAERIIAAPDGTQRIDALANQLASLQTDNRTAQINQQLANQIGQGGTGLQQLDRISAGLGELSAPSAAAADSTARLGSLLGAAPTRAAAAADQIAAGDSSTAALNYGLQQALADYELGGQLDPQTSRLLADQVRSGQAARGNYLGDAAAVQEAATMGQAAEARRAQRLSTLLGVQNQAFGQNQGLRSQLLQGAQAADSTQLAGQGQEAALLGQLYGQGQGMQGQQAAILGQQAGLVGQAFGQQQGYQGQQAAMLGQLYGQTQGTAGQQAALIGQQAGLAGQSFGQAQAAQQSGLGAASAVAADERATRNENFGRDQQGLANASAMVLGQPITNQFGSLQGAQQGAVAFTPMNGAGYQGLNQNAGQQATQFAQGNYGTATQAWQTQANIAAQGNPWMGLVGQVAGAAAGAGAAALI